MNSRSISALLIYLGLLAYAVVTLFPLLWMVITAMKSGRELFRLPPSLVPDLLMAGTPFVNFAAVFDKAGFLGAVLNSMLVATLAAFGQLITCSLAGFVFANLRNRVFTAIYVLLLSTMFFPTEVTLIPEFLLFRQLGWLDTLLKSKKLPFWMEQALLASSRISTCLLVPLPWQASFWSPSLPTGMRSCGR